MTAVTRLSGVRDGLGVKAPVVAATTANITLSGEQTLDGIAVVDGNRVLVKNQTDTTENGIYVASTGAWTRAVDFDGTNDVSQGTTVLVATGTTLGGTFWRVTTASPAPGSAMAFASLATDPSANTIYKVDTIAELQALSTGSYDAATLTESGKEGDFFFRSGDYTASEDSYAVIAANDTAIGSGAWVKKFYRPPTPQDFGQTTGSLTSPAGIQRAITYAAANTGELLFDAQYIINDSIDLSAGIKYIGAPGHLIDGSSASVGAFYTDNIYTDGIMQLEGSQGSQITLSRDIVPILSSTINGNMTQSSGTATINTYGYHGLTTGDYVYVIFLAGYPSIASGAMDYLTQIVSDEQMAYDAPVQVTVTDSDTFTYSVGSGATSPVSGSSVIVFKAHNLIKTGSAHGLSVGDWVELDTNVAIPVLSGAQTIDYAEKARVARVIDTTTAIIHGGVKWSHLTSNSAAMRKLTLAAHTEFQGLKIKGYGSSETGTANDGATGLSLDLVESATITDCYIHDCEMFSINVQRYGNVDIVRPRITADFTDDGGRVSGVTKYPYAICYGGHGNNLKIDKPYINGLFRHGISEATTGSNAGITNHVDIAAPYVVGTISSGIAVHYPNDGYTVRGGFVSTLDGWGIDVRAGNFKGHGIRGYGGWGLLGVSGHPNNIELNDCQTQDVSRDAFYISASTSASSREGTFINFTNLYAKNCRRVVYMIFASGERAEVNLTRIGGDNTEFGAVYCEFDSTNKGKFVARDIHVDDVVRYNTTAYLVEVKYSDDFLFDNLSGSAGANASGFLPYSLTSCTNGYMRQIQDDPGITSYISGGALTLIRSDDHQVIVRGEGDAVDNLDQIINLNTNQRVTLVRYSSAITIRDEGTSGVAAASGGIQTAGGTSVVLDSAYRTATITGVGTAAYPVVTVDATGV